MPPLLVDLIHARACKPFCEKSLTLPTWKSYTILLSHNTTWNLTLIFKAGREMQLNFSPRFRIFIFEKLLYSDNYYNNSN